MTETHRAKATQCRWRAAMLLGLAWTVLLASSAEVAGQNYPRYAPQTPEQPASLPDLPNPEAPKEVSDDRELVASLDAIILVDAAAKVSKSRDQDDLAGIHLNIDAPDSLLHSPQLHNELQAHLGQPITLRRLNVVARAIFQYFRRHKMPVVDVQLPEQRITGGTVHFVVVESRIGSVKIQSGQYFAASSLKRWVRDTHVGSRIYEPNLQQDLLWLNQNPFSRVNVDFQPGVQKGTTDVIYRVKDVRPLRAYVGIDDSGVEVLNFGRAFGGLTYGNAFGRGGILGYQFTADEEFSLLRAHSANYTQPVSREWSWQAFGSWAAVSPALPGGLAQQGESWQLGVGMTRHLYRTANESANLRMGFDFKSTNNNLEFAGQLVANSTADLAQLRFGYDHLIRGATNDTFRSFAIDVFVGPGEGLSGNSAQADFATLRPGTSPDYVYTRLQLDDSRLLGSRWQLVSRFSGQIASERLLFSETLGMGGFDSVRGFDQRVFNADHGWIANLELGPRTHRWGSIEQQRTLRCYTFLDLANGYLEDPLPGEDASTFAVSVGAGARFQITNRLILRADYGHGVKNFDAVQRNERFHLGLTWLTGPRFR